MVPNHIGALTLGLAQVKLFVTYFSPQCDQIREPPKGGRADYISATGGFQYLMGRKTQPSSQWRP